MLFRSIKKTANVDLYFHNYNRKVFETLINEANYKYTTYILMPGKFTNIAPLLESLSGRVFLLDHFHPELAGKYSSVAQNFEKDTYEALVHGLPHLKKYDHIIMVQKEEKEPIERYNGLCTFCEEHDDVVDDLFNEVKTEMMQAIREQNLDADRVVDYLMMAKYLEKVGDHAVNIAEWAIFRMTGDMGGARLY